MFPAIAPEGLYFFAVVCLDVVQGFLGSWSAGAGGGGANNVPWRLHLVCVTVTKYAATPADVVNVREHQFHGMFLFLFAKLAHALGATLASGLCCYALWSQWPSNLTPNDLEWARSFQQRHNASITSSILEELPKMFVAELRKDAFKPFGHGISYINKHFQTFFPKVLTKMIVPPARKNHSLDFELAHAVRNDTF